MQRRTWILGSMVAVWVALAMVPVRGGRVEASSPDKARGHELFATKGCVQCHGVDGIGGGKGPDLQRVRSRLSKEQIAKQISDGGEEMPPYRDALTVAEIDDLAEYLHAKRKHIVAPPKAPTPVAKPKNPDDDSN